jgi:DNA ligase-1
VRLIELVDASRAIGATRSRLQKRALVAASLARAQPDEVALIVSYLGGVLPQGRIGVGPALVRELHNEPVASESTLTLAEVDAAFSRIGAVSGAGAQGRRRDELGRLFARGTHAERDFLARLLLGEIRQGALEGILVEGIAEASGIPANEIRRAVMLASDPVPVAKAVLVDGRAALSTFRMAPMSPIRPMLAQPAEDIGDALGTLGEAVLDYKLDGARVQVHRAGDDVRIFSRRLHDVTASLPDVVTAVLGLPGGDLIMDGEVIALRDNGRPHPFQVTMRRFGRKTDVERKGDEIPLNLFLFDCLYLDGGELIDEPLSRRRATLEELADEKVRVPGIVTADGSVAAEFLARAFAEGHEGIMAKAPDSRYAAGNRGADWLKIKQAHSLDLVVLAAEWGSGRRRGWLSNLHLGARNPEDGTFVMLGKTFKGLTDKMLETQTAALLEREIGRDEHVVHVRPELVVEIAVNEIQASPQYPAGMALRFARVKRYRPDKNAADADTIGTVRDIFTAQAGPGD